MSKLKLQGNASGTGTITLASGNTSSNVTFTLPTADGSPGQFMSTDGSGNLSFASGVSAGSANTFTAAQTFRAANAVRSEAASTQDAIVVAGRAGGTSSYAVTLTPTTLSANRTVTFPDETFTVGFRNVPISSTTTTVATSDVGKAISLSAGITIPDATFAAGDIVSLYNNTSGNLTITCSITTAYIAGTDSDKATMTLATRGVATILFISGTVCVVSGNVS